MSLAHTLHLPCMGLWPGKRPFPCLSPGRAGRRRVIGCLLLALLLLLPASARALEVRVAVEGLDGEIKENVLAWLSLAVADGSGLDEARARYLHARAEDEIRSALEPFGFYRPHIDSSLAVAGQEVSARYRIDPGPRVLYRRVDLVLEGEGRQDPAFRRLLANAGIAAGDPLDHRRYRQLKADFETLANRRGYPEARWQEAGVQVDTDKLAADLRMIFATGPRYRYGAIEFDDSPLAQEFLQRFVNIRPGQPVHLDDLLELQRRLGQGDYFRRVEVRPVWSRRAKGRVPVQVTLEPRARTRYRTGLGFDTDTGARLSAGIKRRRVNAWGHGFDTRLQLGTQVSELGFQYRIPGPRPTQEDYSLGLGLESDRSGAINRRTLNLGASWQVRRGRWNQVLGIDWEREDFDLGGEARVTEFLVPRASGTLLVADNPLRVQRGYRVGLELSGAHEGVLAETNFLSLKMGAKGILSLSQGWRLIGRGELGRIEVEDLDDLPASRRFYAGGARSVRGYAFESLASRDDAGDLRGGRSLLVASLEVDYRLTEDWRLALFTDRGGALAGDDKSLSTGLGLGIRWQSPLGPLALDLGQAQDLPGRPWRLHFSLGPEL